MIIISFLLSVGLVSAEKEPAYLKYETGIFYPLDTQLVQETADLFIRVNISMPHIDSTNLNCTTNTTEKIRETISLINNHYRLKFDELARNFGIEVESMDLIKVHFCDCRRSVSEFYCGYPRISCCALKDSKSEELRCVHDKTNKQVWMNRELSHYTSKCFKLATSLLDNLPHKKYFEGDDVTTIQHNEVRSFKIKTDYQTRFPYDHGQFKRLADDDIDTSVFFDFIEQDKVTFTLTPNWTTNKGYRCIALLLGAHSYQETDSDLVSKFNVKVFINDTIACNFTSVEFFDQAKFDARLVMFNCPEIRISNVIVTAEIVENSRWHEIMIHRDSCANMLNFFKEKRKKLQQQISTPIEDLPLNPPAKNASTLTNDTVVPTMEPGTPNPTKRTLSLEEVLNIGAAGDIVKEVLPLNPDIEESVLAGVESSGSRSLDSGEILTDDADYSDILSEFQPIDSALIPDSDFTYRYVKIKQKSKRSVFSTIGDMIKYYAYGGPYTNLYNIKEFHKVDQRLEKVKQILAINIQSMQDLTHSMQADMTSMTNLICQMGETVETSLIKLKATLMMLDLKLKLSEIYSQCHGRQVPFLYANTIRNFMCSVNIKSCETLARLINCDIVHVRVTGHTVGRMHLMLKLSVPIVDDRLKIYKRIELPKPMTNKTIESDFVESEILRDSINSSNSVSPFVTKNEFSSYYHNHLIYHMTMPNYLVVNVTGKNVHGEVDDLSSEDFVISEEIQQSCAKLNEGKITSDCSKYQISKVIDKCFVKHIASTKQIYVVSNEDLKVIDKANNVRKCKVCLLNSQDKTYDCDNEIINNPIIDEFELKVAPDMILLDKSEDWNSFNQLSKELKRNISSLDKQLNIKISQDLLQSLNNKESDFWTIVTVIVTVIFGIIIAAACFIVIKRVRTCWLNRESATHRELLELMTTRDAPVEMQ